MPNNVSTRRIKNLCTFVDFSYLKNSFDEFVLFIIFVLVKSWKTTVVILGTFKPCVSSIDLLGISPKRVSSFHVFVHSTIKKKKHCSVINIWSILKLMTVRNTAIRLNSIIDHKLDSGVKLFNIFTSLQKSQ